MLEIRDLKHLSALARHRHFAKAAQECGMTQPAFSMRIRKLEERLNTALVKRGNRFQGFTTEGEAILRQARKILDDVKALEQEVTSADGYVSGILILGAVPTAATHAAHLAVRLRHDSPGIVVRIVSATSIGIQQGIEEGTLDAGLTYSDGVSAEMFSVLPLYDESYVLLAPVGLMPGAKASVTWAEAADLPLCLLDPGMQNRRILDQIFKEVGVQPQVVSETNALSTAVVMAREGVAASVIPSVLSQSLGNLQGTVSLPLVAPVITKPIALVSSVKAPGLPTVEALKRVISVSGQ